MYAMYGLATAAAAFCAAFELQLQLCMATQMQDRQQQQKPTQAVGLHSRYGRWTAQSAFLTYVGAH